MVERPMIRADETMPLEENMNFAVHPGYNTVDDVDRRSATTTWSRPTASATACTRPRRRFSRSTDLSGRHGAERDPAHPSP